MIFNLAQETGRSAFATRASAIELRNSITSLLATLQDSETLEISLEGVEALTISFADEFVAKLALERRFGSTDTFFLLSNSTEEVLETIEIALERRSLFVAHRASNGDLRLIAAPAHLKSTFQLAIEMREFTARQLADRLEIKLPAANNRIKQLAEAGVVIRRRQIPLHGGREYLYSAA